MAIVLRSVFHEGSKYCLHVLSDECLEMTFLKLLVLTTQVHQKSALFANIGIFLDKGFKFINRIRKSEAVNLLQNADLSEKIGTLKYNKIKYN